MPSAIESDDVVLGPNLAGETPASATTMQDGADRPNEKESPLSHARSKWRLGMLRDKQTDEVPGSVLLLSKVNKHNAPLGLDPVRRRDSISSFRSMSSGVSQSLAMFGTQRHVLPDKKKTKDGKIILEPQPDESGNDPLNWSAFRRDAALLSLGFYCMLGGGMTPILAAGFTNVAETYNVSVPRVALTTGLYMMGLGVGSVIASPTAIAFGKRPVYLVACILFVLTSIWCALSPNYASLIVARVFMGLAVSPVECLPSATIAEIFFLHERAYRLGVYTLLLLGGKNLVPLASAAVIQGLGWRWVFWIVAIIVGACFFLLFFFVPETFWDRTPRPHKSHRRPSFSAMRRMTSPRRSATRTSAHVDGGNPTENGGPHHTIDRDRTSTPQSPRRAHFAAEDRISDFEHEKSSPDLEDGDVEKESSTRLPQLRGRRLSDAVSNHDATIMDESMPTASPVHSLAQYPSIDEQMHSNKYTAFYRSQPPKNFVQTLKPYSGRLNHDNWFKVAFRPFVLYAYPAILWSSAVYSLSVGWLIVLSESVSTIYRSADTYHFSAIATGLVYISPFIGGVLGTAVAGKVSDLVVRYIARRNGGIYEPEFRLIMAIPVAISTVIGLMGFGWSAQERDNFWVPTIFFGIISFGCCMGSTTAITFAVDSYRQYAGEALVTLNFSKNILHGLVFSLFFNNWLDSEGSKDVFICLGAIQLFFLLWTIPMYIYGKRARMWTVRMNFMGRF